MREKLFYTAFGLRIGSEIRLPLVELKGPAERLDVQISLENSARPLLSTPKAFTYEDTPVQSIVFRIPKVAIFEITLTNEIKIFPEPNAQIDAIVLFLLGSAFGVILHRQEAVVLHGSAVKIDEGAIIFLGPSGIGKSTLATAFAQNGFSLLTDDVAFVKFEMENACVIPSYPQTKLWRESLDALSIPSKELKSLYSRINKFSVRMDRAFEAKPQMLHAIFILETHLESLSKLIHFDRIFGAEIYSALHKNTYRVEFLSQIGSPRRHFQYCARLAQKVPVYRLSRPVEGISSRLIAEESLKFLKKERGKESEFNSFNKCS